MKIFDKLKKNCKLPIMILQKVKPTFITTDGVEHTGQNYKWADSTGLICTVGEYIMYNVKSNGYLQDNKGVMYPLTNVVSITWNIVDERKVYGQSHYSIYFSNNEVDKMVIVE